MLTLKILRLGPLSINLCFYFALFSRTHHVNYNLELILGRLTHDGPLLGFLLPLYIVELAIQLLHLY